MTGDELERAAKPCHPGVPQPVSSDLPWGKLPRAHKQGGAPRLEVSLTAAWRRGHRRNRRWEAVRSSCVSPGGGGGAAKGDCRELGWAGCSEAPVRERPGPDVAQAPGEGESRSVMSDSL